MKQFIKGNRGSMTLEATLVFPFVMVFVLLTVFFCIIVFQAGMTNYVAYQSSNIVAYNYTSSQKDLNGEISPDELTGNDNGDGLYWRISDGVSEFFSSLGIGGFNDGNGGISRNKQAVITDSYSGSVTIDGISQEGNILLYKKITVNTSSGLYMPQIFKNIIGVTNVSGKSSSIVTDSTEMVRTYNFARFLMSFTPLENSGSITEAVEEWIGG